MIDVEDRGPTTFKTARGAAGCVVHRDPGIGRGLLLSAPSPSDSNREARESVVDMPHSRPRHSRSEPATDTALRLRNSRATKGVEETAMRMIRCGRVRSSSEQRFHHSPGPSGADGKQLANHAPCRETSGPCTPIREPPPKAPGYPFGSVRVSRHLTATPVSRVDRALTPP